MRKFKKVVAVAAALTMALSSTVAFADNLATGTSADSGYLEGVAPTDLYDVVLPYVADGTYAPTLDPAQLLARYDASDATFTSGASMYFDTGAKNASSAAIYADTSAVATVVNKGTDDVIFSVSASVRNATGNALTFVTGSAVNADNKANVAMSLVPTAKGTITASALTGASLNTTGDALNVSGSALVKQNVVTAGAVDFGTDANATLTFVVDGDVNNFDIVQGTDSTNASGHKYTYVAKADAVWSTVGYAISGKCNINPLADWSQVVLTEDVISVDVVYTLSKVTDTQKTELQSITPNPTTGVVTGLTMDGSSSTATTITPTKTLTANGDGTKLYITATAGVTVTSAKVYSESDYAANGSSATSLGTLTCNVGGTGTVSFLKDSLDSICTTSGSYAVVFELSTGTETAVYTVQ